MRTVTIELDLIPGVPAAQRTVKFRPVKKGQASGNAVWPAESHSVTTDDDGLASVSLPTGIEIEVTLPDGWRGVVVVPPGATPVTLASLLLTTAAVNVAQSAIDAHAQLIAGVGASGTLGHVRVDGSTITVNPSTGVISTAGGGAPIGASYLTAAADATLTDERVATSTATVEWDFTVAGQARANVPDGAITSAKIATGAVTTPKIAALAVTSVELADDAVTAAKIAANAVTTGKIASNAVTTGKIDGAAVTAPKIADDAVTTAKIADGAVTFSKMQDVAANRLLGREGTAGVVQEIQIGSGLTLSGGALSASGGGGTNLDYVASPSDGTVTSDTGTDAVIPLATLSAAGLMSPVEHQRVSFIHYGDDDSRLALSTIEPLYPLSTTLGFDSEANNGGATAVGAFAVVNGANGAALGVYTTVDAPGAVAIGAGALAETPRTCAVRVGELYSDASIGDVHRVTQQGRYGGDIRDMAELRSSFEGAPPGQWRTRLDLAAGSSGGLRVGVSIGDDSGFPAVGFCGSSPTRIKTVGGDWSSLHRARRATREFFLHLEEKGLVVNDAPFQFSPLPNPTWINKTAGANDTTIDSFTTPFPFLRMRMTAATGGGLHRSWYLFDAPVGWANVYATIAWSGALTGAWRNFGLSVRSPADERAMNLALTSPGVMTWARWNTTASGSFIGATDVQVLSFSEVYHIRIQRTGGTLRAYVSLDGETWDFIADHSEAWVTNLTQCGLFLERQANQDITGYCYSLHAE